MRIWRGVFCLALLFLAAAPRLDAAANLLHNGNLSVGSGESVDGWRTEAWVQDVGSTTYHWIPPQPGQPGELEVLNQRDNDARWQQPISLAPGWYHISVEARTHGVLDFHTGANISVLDGGIVSADLRGDSDWRRLGFYLQIGPKGADVDVCLRLGGYGNLTRGDAFFRDARVEKVTAPPPDTANVFDLAAVRRAQTAPPIGRPWTLWATFSFLLGLGALGWRLMAESARAQVAAKPPVEVPPAARRGKRARAR
jgi:hypothetical protein